MSPNSSIKKTESASFRLDSSTLEKLRHDADSKNISLNVLVNQILANYTQWDMTATGAGWMVIPKDALKSMINKLDEKDVIKIGKDTADYTRDIRLLMTNADTLDGFLSILKNRSIRSGFQIRETNDNGTKKIIIQHDMGTNWSLYTKSLYEEVIHQFGASAAIAHTQNTLIVEIK